MKKHVLLLIILSVLFSNQIYSQYKTRLELSSGLAFCGSGDLPGSIHSVAFEKAIFPKLTVVPSVDYISLGRYKEYAPYGNRLARGNSFETSFFFYLSKDRRINLKIGIGGYLRKFVWMYEAPENGSITIGNVVHVADGEQAFYLGNIAAGYSFSLGFDAPFSERVCLTSRINLQNDTEGDILSSCRLGLKIGL